MLFIRYFNICIDYFYAIWYNAVTNTRMIGVTMSFLCPQGGTMP